MAEQKQKDEQKDGPKAQVNTTTAAAVVPPCEHVRRRIPGYKLVNGGWRRDPEAQKGS
jgi:hypothetical protein